MTILSLLFLSLLEGEKMKDPGNEVVIEFALTFFFLNSCVGLVWAVKNCKAGCISSRLAGYWEKFSISNNRASDEPLWLQ